MSRLLRLAREAATKTALEHNIKGEHADKIARAVADKIRSVYGDAQYVLILDGDITTSETVQKIDVDRMVDLHSRGLITADELSETAKRLEWFGEDAAAEIVHGYAENI